MSELKTLKDFYELGEISAEIEHTVRQAHMNDGSGYDESNYCVRCVDRARQETLEKLKQEAIKWVKEFKHKTGKTSLGKFGKNTCAGVCYGFIQFFNITEEDLKGGKTNE